MLETKSDQIILKRSTVFRSFYKKGKIYSLNCSSNMNRRNTQTESFFCTENNSQYWRKLNTEEMKNIFTKTARLGSRLW